MGLFWHYFRDTLRPTFIQTSDALALLAEGSARLLDDVRDIIITLRDQYSPTRCEPANLSRFAASRGLVRHALEPEEHWLARISFAYHYWARGGRASSLEEALRLGFGFAGAGVVRINTSGALYDETSGAGLYDESTGAILDYDNSERWAEFLVVCYLRPDQQVSGVSVMNGVIWAINEVKPARSKLAGVLFIAPLYDETSGGFLFDETTGSGLTD